MADVHQSKTGDAASGNNVSEQKTKQQLKAERKASFLAKKAAEKEKRDKKSENEKTGGSPKKENLKENKLNKTEKTGEKSKADLKAERRRIQEMQRATKSAKKVESPKDKTPQGKDRKSQPKQENKINKDSAVERSPSKSRSSARSRSRSAAKGPIFRKAGEKSPKTAAALAKNFKTMNLFSHLHQFEKNPERDDKLQLPNNPMYAPVEEIGSLMSHGVIVGSNARCLAVLGAVKDVIVKYRTPPGAKLAEDLDRCLDSCYDYLNACRPHNVCMLSAIEYLKREVRRIPVDMKVEEAKESLYTSIDKFVRANITNAQELISLTAASKIQNGDIILTYGCSTSVQKAFLQAHDQGKIFQVIVSDGRPKKEGEHLLRFLKKNNIRCSYILLTSIASVMCEVNRVIMGAHSLHTNGAVMSRVGTSQVALIAKAFNVPVLICCETYKFCENVSVDSFVHNELGSSSDMVCFVPGKGKILEDWNKMSLCLLNLTYDVTPPELVSVVITERGMLPCSSVPVVLRVKGNQQSL